MLAWLLGFILYLVLFVLVSFLLLICVAAWAEDDSDDIRPYIRIIE